MEFIGARRKVSEQSLKEGAEMLGIPLARLKAVQQVEARNSGFDSEGHPKNLFEPHLFWKHLGNTPKRKQAVKLGLAYPSWGERPYPRTEKLAWARFMQAYELAPREALLSTSWGLGQTLGENFAMYGYSSVEEMVSEYVESEDAQLYGMLMHIKNAKNRGQTLMHWLQKKRYDYFAEGYNGKMYWKHQYDVKIADAERTWEMRLNSGQPLTDADGILRMGSQGDRVKGMQAALKRRGYAVNADGVFGKMTRDVVNEWKSDNLLTPDAQMTPQDLQKLDTSPDRPVPEARQAMTMADLKKTSRIAKWSSDLKTWGAGIIATVTGSKVAEQQGILDNVEGTINTVQRAKGVFGTVQDVLSGFGVNLISFIAQHSVILLIGGGILALYLVNNIAKARLEDQRNGTSI